MRKGLKKKNPQKSQSNTRMVVVAKMSHQVTPQFWRRPLPFRKHRKPRHTDLIKTRASHFGITKYLFPVNFKTVKKPVE